MDNGGLAPLFTLNTLPGLTSVVGVHLVTSCVRIYFKKYSKLYIQLFTRPHIYKICMFLSGWIKLGGWQLGDPALS